MAGKSNSKGGSTGRWAGIKMINGYPMVLTKTELQQIASEGNFIYDDAYKLHADLDGTEARKYLESKGFKVIKNFDTGKNGLAVTACGIKLSTNGYLCKLR